MDEIYAWNEPDFYPHIPGCIDNYGNKVSDTSPVQVGVGLDPPLP